MNRERLIGPIDSRAIRDLVLESNTDAEASTRQDADHRAPAVNGAHASIDASRHYLRTASRLRVLRRNEFQRQLVIEKRRSDRSKAPLATALLHITGMRNGSCGEARTAVDLLQEQERETDIVGDMDGGDVMVLLPHTDERGARKFVERISARAGDFRFSARTATYPHDLFDVVLADRPDGMQSDAVLFDEPVDERSLGPVAKRGIDIAGALVAILTLAPLMLVAAVAIALTSPGPVMYRQVRLGRRGKRFVLYKFRSMYVNADERIHRDYVTSLIAPEKGGSHQGGAPRPWAKLQSDPRITPVGQLLRRTSIDELPQLFNVLKGDLSLVGPRPAIPYEAEQYEAWHLRRVETKPGISGPWQVDSRLSTFDDMVRMDLGYAKGWSLLRDLRIMAKTIKVVLRRTGAG